MFADFEEAAKHVLFVCSRFRTARKHMLASCGGDTSPDNLVHRMGRDALGCNNVSLDIWRIRLKTTEEVALELEEYRSITIKR